MKKQDFLQLIHRLWVADFGNMDDYQQCLWALMLKHGVTWKAVVELDSDMMYKALSEGMETDSLFEIEVNDKSKDRFENFEPVCERFMCFEGMEDAARLSDSFAKLRSAI